MLNGDRSEYHMLNCVTDIQKNSVRNIVNPFRLGPQDFGKSSMPGKENNLLYLLFFFPVLTMLIMFVSGRVLGE